MVMQQETVNTTPWYRHFWVWVLLGLPLAAILAGIYTLYLAAERPDGLVVDDYYREGLAINRRLDREARARTLGIRARLSLDPGKGVLELVPEHGFGETLPTLVLSFIHPTLSQQDREFTLRAAPEGGRYRAEGVTLAPGRWHIRLRPETGDWQLDTTVTLGQAGVISLNAANP